MRLVPGLVATSSDAGDSTLPGGSEPLVGGLGALVVDFLGPFGPRKPVTNAVALPQDHGDALSAAVRAGECPGGGYVGEWLAQAANGSGSVG